MLTEQTLQQLQSLNLLEMARKWQEQQRDPQMAELSFDERFDPVDSQSLSQHNKRIARLPSEAKLRLPQACVGGRRLIPRSRGAGQTPVAPARSTRRFMVVTERRPAAGQPPPAGQTYVSRALGQAALRKGHRVRYYRTCRLLDELALAWRRRQRTRSCCAVLPASTC